MAALLCRAEARGARPVRAGAAAGFRRRQTVIMPSPALTVGAALPDPPFELMQGGKPAGFDIELTRVIAARLGRNLAPHAL